MPKIRMALSFKARFSDHTRTKIIDDLVSYVTNKYEDVSLEEVTQ